MGVGMFPPTEYISMPQETVQEQIMTDLPFDIKEHPLAGSYIGSNLLSALKVLSRAADA